MGSKTRNGDTLLPSPLVFDDPERVKERFSFEYMSPTKYTKDEFIINGSQLAVVVEEFKRFLISAGFADVLVDRIRVLDS